MMEIEQHGADILIGTNVLALKLKHWMKCSFMQKWLCQDILHTYKIKALVDRSNLL